MKKRRGERDAGWGIRGLLAVMLIVTLTPFIALEAYRGAADVRARRHAVERQAQEQAMEAATITEDFLGRSGRYLAGVAGAPEVRSLDSAAMQELFESVRKENPNYVSVFLFDTSGVERSSTQPAFHDEAFLSRPYVQRALATGDTTVSDVVGLPGTDRSVLVLAHRVLGPDNAVRGVMGIAVNVARLSDVIGYLRLPEGSVLLLVQQDGTSIVASADPDVWVGQTLSGLPRSSTDQSHPRVSTALTTTRDGVRRVLAYRPVQGTPWVMVAATPQAEVDTVVRESLLRVSEEAALAILGTVLLAWLMLRRVVLPIRILSDGASDFAAGLLDRRISLHRRDELGTLANALNSMAAALQRRLDEAAAHAAALEALNRRETEFVATASHELKTPVTAIRSYAEALLRPDIVDPEVRRRCLIGIDLSSLRLAKLARTLLDVSRIDGDRVMVLVQAVDPVIVARRAIVQVSPPDENAVILRVVGEMSLVDADPERLEDVLANLIDNARKFSAASSSVEVDVRCDGADVVVAVRDAGCGIQAEELGRIFDRFYQVDRGIDRRAAGSGLGLYIARAYVLAMGGRLWVESALGAGSTFFISLPAAKDRRDRDSHSDASAVPVASGRR